MTRLIKILFILFIPLFAISACSSGDNNAASTSNTNATNTKVISIENTAPEKTSSESPFSTQLNVLETAKQVGGAATDSINQQQRALEAAKD